MNITKHKCDFAALAALTLAIAAFAEATATPRYYVGDSLVAMYDAVSNATNVATVPTAATGLVYNGTEQTGVPAGEGYTLSGTAAATAAGTYTATATLKDGYSWAGQASDAVQIQWSIARGTNAWSSAPSISAASWAFGATPGVLTPGRTAFGEVTATISCNGGPAEAFSGTVPEEPGAYTIIYTAPEATADYAAPDEAEKTVSFRIIVEPSGFDAYACYTTYPATFKIIGRITPGSGETFVTVHYSLNSDSCGESMQAEISPSGSFVCEIPYANAEGSLTWRAEATASDMDTVLSIGPATITRAHDASCICYTWTGAAGDNRWTNIGNWSAEKTDCYGYPGFYDSSGVSNADWVSYVQFDRSTAPEGIDLEGGTYAFITNGAFIVGQNITVKMKNGTLYFAGPDGGLPTFNDETVGLIGASGTSLVFENVKLDNLSSKNLIPAAGSTLVFEGANATPGGWKYNPIKANTKFVVRNGTLTGNAFGTGTIAASHVVEISNAVWSVTANIANAKSLAPKVVFRDGPDRAAQFITSGSFLTYGRYDIKIPAEGRALPAVKAKSRTGSSALTFDIDVTDYLSADRVPLFQFTSTTAQTMPPCTLNVTAGGVDVKAARNASLVFESNTLYYKQDEQVVVPPPEPIEVTLFDEYPEWGYKVEGLGVAHDETALVFTNQNASSMAWTVPADLADVQFLVVGGGGGGGADYNPGSGSAPFLGGGGGGGGGVVTGVVSTVVADTVFSIKVGAGGAGGICNKTQVNGGFGASYAGSDSTVSLGGVAVLTAFGGGNDKGTTSSSAKSGRVGGTGGSNAGSRGGYGTAQGAPTRGSVAASFASQLAGYGVLGNVGGSGNTGEQYWGYYSASGGGGGATTPGGTPTDYSTGGTGGEGLASDITGTLRVYGSGGGGGTISGNLGGAGGTGAGSGNIDTGDGGSGQDALANQGGGGGGGGRSGNGGKGGSGIVVLRFRVPSAAPAMPSVAGEEVAPAEVFTKAREAKSIVYPSEPTVTGDVGSQVVSFGGVDVNVPDYYTATLSDTTVTLALNDNAKPVVADEDETSGIEIVDGKVRIHLGNVKSALYYTILTATSLDAVEWTPCGAAEQGQDDFEFSASGATRFYKASVRDEAE